MGIIFFVGLYIYTRIFQKPLCVLQNICGVACCGCGMTRGFLAILRWDYVTAFEYNILAIPLFLGICIHAILVLTDILFAKSYVDKLERLLVRKEMCVLYFLLAFIAALENNGIFGG